MGEEFPSIRRIDASLKRSSEKMALQESGVVVLLWSLQEGSD